MWNYKGRLETLEKKKDTLKKELLSVIDGCDDETEYVCYLSRSAFILLPELQFILLFLPSEERLGKNLILFYS